ncbi:hypothetical protein J7E97_14180 [Streptomyces sp. ISL-66]|uniref:hypothetical protein n=1 Tax=Streptomyces sp. ISL-66 TaxID=2819186 RepID=UPI001BE6C2B6|nr:hypothetical protein [Streptomyces sp. ISL-66]MBT2468988.1 hypothetical protein [Streptomyces sp. ISL-66]
MSTTPVLATPCRTVRAAARTAVGLPPSALDAMLDAAYETHRRFRHGAFAEPCPTCHVSAGELCLARRSVHAARRLAHRARETRSELDSAPLTPR